MASPNPVARIFDLAADKTNRNFHQRLPMHFQANANISICSKSTERSFHPWSAVRLLFPARFARPCGSRTISQQLTRGRRKATQTPQPLDHDNHPWCSWHSTEEIRSWPSISCYFEHAPFDAGGRAPVQPDGLPRSCCARRVSGPVVVNHDRLPTVVALSFAVKRVVIARELGRAGLTVKTRQYG